MAAVAAAAAAAAAAPTTRPPLSSPSSSLSHVYFNNGRSAFTTSRPRKPSSVRLRAAANTRRIQASFDPDIRVVLELASDSELYDIENILFGPSYFSPVLKSLARRNDAECYLCLDVPEEREEFINLLESRFLFLAADARSTIRGWRPSYRNVLLDVRKKFGIPCSSKLPTGDLEAEIFLHLLQEYSSEKAGEIPLLQEDGGGAGYGPQPRNMQACSSLKVAADEVRALILKGGSALTFARIFQVLARKLSGKVLTEAANYQIKCEILKKGGQLAAINLESRIALLAARQGFSSAASRYLGFRSLTMFLGTMLWGTLLADVVIQMMGTDYSRIVRAIYAFAQIRLMRIYAWAVVGLAYTLLQIPFAAYFVTTGKRMTSGFGFLLFDFVADKGVTLVLATGVGAGFGATLDLKKVIDDLEKVLEQNGLFNIADPLNKLDRFFDLGSASTGLLLVAFLFMVAQSVLSSLALCKRVSAN